MTVNHIARALALTLAICMAQSIVASASKPTAAQLAYANTFKDVGKNRPADSIPADHFAESRDISHAAAKLHKESAAAEKEFTKAAKGFVDATSKSLADSYEADHGVKAEDETTLANTLRPVNIKESKKIDKAQESCSGADCAYAKAIAKTYHTSLLEVAAKAQSKAEVTSAASGCEVCVYVVENKQMHQPFLCRGLKDPAYQQTCVTTLISMMWWLENQVYWINYGCQRSSGSGGWEWVKPCPAHAVCSWMQNLYDRQPFCPTDPKYRKPA